jgi:hypothetical protein
MKFLITVLISLGCTNAMAASIECYANYISDKSTDRVLLNSNEPIMSMSLNQKFGEHKQIAQYISATDFSGEVQFTLEPEEFYLSIGKPATVATYRMTVAHTAEFKGKKKVIAETIAISPVVAKDLNGFSQRTVVILKSNRLGLKEVVFSCRATEE